MNKDCSCKHVVQSPRPIVIVTPAEQRSSSQVASMRMATFSQAFKHPGWMLEQYSRKY